MTRHLIPIFVCLTLATPALAQLQIARATAAHGLLGPDRPAFEFSPMDEIVLRLNLTGVEASPENRCDLEVAYRMDNAAGQTVINQKGTFQRPLTLGGGRVTAYAVLPIGPKAAPGAYTLRVNVTDRIAGRSVSLEKPLTVSAPSLRVLTPRLSHDLDAKIQAAAVATVGETLYLRVKAAGYATANDRIAVRMTVQMLDATGAEAMPKPIVTEAKIANPAEVKRADALNFNGALSFNRPGNFTLRVTMAEEGGQTAKLEMPLRVVEP